VLNSRTGFQTRQLAAASGRQQYPIELEEINERTKWIESARNKHLCEASIATEVAIAGDGQMEWKTVSHDI
jgi:hypothetical protein